LLDEGHPQYMWAAQNSHLLCVSNEPKVDEAKDQQGNFGAITGIGSGKNLAQQ